MFFSELVGGGALEILEGLLDDLLDPEVPRERQCLGYLRKIFNVIFCQSFQIRHGS